MHFLPNEQSRGGQLSLMRCSLHLCALPCSALALYPQCVSWSKRAAEAPAVMSMGREKKVGGRDPKVQAEWAPFQEFSRKHLPVTPAYISLATPLAREAGKQGWMAGPRWSPQHPRASVSKQGGRRRLVRQLAILPQHTCRRFSF